MAQSPCVCESSPGSVHDKKLYGRARVVGPPDARRTGDTAYIGTSLETPTRKPKGGELTAEQKRRIVWCLDVGSWWSTASAR